MIIPIIPFFFIMARTIIFISGWKVPKWLAKSSFVWNANFWKEYNCIFLDSKTPESNHMIHEELDNLEGLVREHPDCAVVGQSLGGWWAANLALRHSVDIKKLILWTPVCDASAYPIFKAGRFYHPPYRATNHNSGPQRVLTLPATDDLIVPSDAHGYELAKHFNSMTYTLYGGHVYQMNHKQALQYMKDWIET